MKEKHKIQISYDCVQCLMALCLLVLLSFVVEVPDVVHHGDAGSDRVANNPLGVVLGQRTWERCATLGDT